MRADRRSVATLLLICSAVLSNAQQAFISSHMGWPVQHQYNTQMLLASCADGGYFSGGTTDYSLGDKIVYKVDNAGVVQWAVEEHIQPNSSLASLAILPTADSGIVIVNNHYVASNDSIIFMFTKIDKNGLQAAPSKTWYRHTTPISQALTSYFLIRSDGNILVCIPEAQVPFGPSGITLLLFDDTFNLIQHTRFESPTSSFGGVTCCKLDDQDNLYVCGASSLIQVSSQLILQGSAYFTCPGLYFNAEALTISSSGEIYLAGPSGISSYPTRAAVLKTDANYNVDFCKEYFLPIAYSSPDSYSDNYADVDAAGRLHIMTGHASDITHPDTTRYIQYMCFDNSGNVLSSSMYGGANPRGLLCEGNTTICSFMAIENFWSAHTIITRADSTEPLTCFVLPMPVDSIHTLSISVVPMTLNTVADSMTYLLPFQEIPALNYVTFTPENFCLTAGIFEPITETQFTVYPNPAGARLHIEVEGKGIVSIIDSNGKCKFKDSASENVVIDINDWPAGLYFARFENEKGEITTQRIVIY